MFGCNFALFGKFSTQLRSMLTIICIALEKPQSKCRLFSLVS